MIRVRIFTGLQARLLAAALTALCALAAGASSATAAVSPQFTCPDRHICLYPNDDYTGNYPGGQPIVLDPAGTTSAVWFSFDSIGALPHPGSINDNSGTSIWLYDHQEPVQAGINPVCIAHGKIDVDHAFGYFEIFYSDSDCSHNYTTPLP